MNSKPINYEDWLSLGRVIIPCYKGIPKKGSVTQKDLYDMAKNFAISVGKGEVEAKVEAKETKNEFSL